MTCVSYVSSLSVKTSLSSQVGNILLIDDLNVFSRVLSIVFFLRVMLFSIRKENSHYPTSSCRTTMELSPHPNDIKIRLVDMNVSRQTPRPIVKDNFLTELVIKRCKELEVRAAPRIPGRMILDFYSVKCLVR